MSGRRADVGSTIRIMRSLVVGHIAKGGYETSTIKELTEATVIKNDAASPVIVVEFHIKGWEPYQTVLLDKEWENA